MRKLFIVVILVVTTLACGGQDAPQPVQQPARRVLTAEEAAAVRAAAEKRALDQRVEAFPSRKGNFAKQLDALKAANSARQLDEADRIVADLQRELVPLFSSTLGATPDVTALKRRFETEIRALDKAKRSRTEPVELIAEVEYTGTQIKVANLGGDDWEDVKLDLNGGVVFDGFANADGLRFNPMQRKVQKLMITARVNGRTAAKTFRWR